MPEASSPTWDLFTLALARTIEGLPKDGYLIISAKPPRTYYVQFAAGLRAEAVSNHYLQEDQRLSPREQQRLVDLGWMPPDEKPPPC